LTVYLNPPPTPHIAQINLDTPAIVATEETRSLIDPVSLWETKANGIPLAKSIRAPTSSLPRGISDNYIDGERDPTVDTLMPLYLSEELSPRFSRAKATKGWNLRREQEEEEREAFVKAKLSEWHAKGKDTGLENAMKTMGMSGKVRGRTADEVREMARVDYNQSVEERSKLARQAKRVGARYDVDADKWMVQLTGSKMTRKAKRERRAAKREDKLTQLVL
jgi:large subunit ribosomal protein L24